MEDFYHRSINYLRISVTDRCNLRCVYCMPSDGIVKTGHEHIMTFDEIVTFVELAAQKGINKLRITGGEPLVRTGIVDLIAKLSQIKGINEIAMTTNGVLLSKYASQLKAAGLNRVNVSLDSLDPKIYKQLTRGGDLSVVLKGIEDAIAVGLTPVKINTVLIGGVNENEVLPFIQYAKANNVKWRLIELMPIGQISGWAKEKFIDGELLLSQFPNVTKIEDNFDHHVKRFYFKDYDMKIGLINAMTGKFCSHCNRLRLTADGYLKPCLHNDIEYYIKDKMSDEKALLDIYNQCILNKPKAHQLLDSSFIPSLRNMNKIGG